MPLITASSGLTYSTQDRYLLGTRPCTVSLLLQSAYYTLLCFSNSLLGRQLPRLSLSPLALAPPHTNPRSHLPPLTHLHPLTLAPAHTCPRSHLPPDTPDLAHTRRCLAAFPILALLAIPWLTSAAPIFTKTKGAYLAPSTYSQMW